MKKYFLLISMIICVFSCTSDVQFSTPGFQARKDNFLWRATKPQASIAGGILTVKAFTGVESVTMKIPAPLSTVFSNNPLTYSFGITQSQPTNDAEANFTGTTDGVILNYSTNTAQSNGQFVITSFDLTSRKLTGTFRFNATYLGVDPAIAKNVNFQEGFMFEIPVY
jgi:hypothetical protein